MKLFSLENISGRVKSWFGRFSIRGMIGLAILASFLIILPTVSLSLFYFTEILNNLTTITERDVWLGRISSDMSMEMQRIYNLERTFRMFGRTEDKERIISRIDDIQSMIQRAREVVEKENADLLSLLSDDLRQYSESFNLISEYIERNAAKTENSREEREQLHERFRSYQSEYRTILARLDSAQTTAESDSIIEEAYAVLNTFTGDVLIESGDEEESGQLSYFQENLDTSRRRFLDHADELAARSWTNMLEQKQESLIIEARAKRNIFSMLFITAVICIFMVTYLPRMIVKPVSDLTRIFKRALTGDLGVRAHVSSGDEIGALATQFNQVINKFNTFDEIKTKKVASQQRLINRILNNFDVPIAVLNQKLNITFYNKAFADITGIDSTIKTPVEGIHLEGNETLKNIKQNLKEHINKGASVFTVNIVSQAGNKIEFTSRIVRDQSMKFESILMIPKHTPVTTPKNES